MPSKIERSVLYEEINQWCFYMCFIFFQVLQLDSRDSFVCTVKAEQVFLLMINFF